MAPRAYSTGQGTHIDGHLALGSCPCSSRASLSFLTQQPGYTAPLTGGQAKAQGSGDPRRPLGRGRAAAGRLQIWSFLPRPLCLTLAFQPGATCQRLGRCATATVPSTPSRDKPGPTPPGASMLLSPRPSPQEEGYQAADRSFGSFYGPPLPRFAAGTKRQMQLDNRKEGNGYSDELQGSVCPQPAERVGVGGLVL